MTDESDAIADATLARLRPETRSLLDFLTDRPLSKYPSRSSGDRLRWARRDLRATVRYEVYGTTPGRVVTLDDVDELLRSPGLADRVWDRLVTADLREQIPLAHVSRPPHERRAPRWLRAATAFLRREPRK